MPTFILVSVLPTAPIQLYVCVNVCECVSVRAHVVVCVMHVWCVCVIEFVHNECLCAHALV